MDEVGQHPFEQSGIGQDVREVVGELETHHRTVGAAHHHRRGFPHGHPVGVDGQCPGLQPAHVQQVADDVVELVQGLRT